MALREKCLDAETKVQVVREWLAAKWSERYPSISSDYDPELQKPIFGQHVKGARRFELSTRLYETLLDGWYFDTITSYKFTKREGSFLDALGAKSVGGLLRKTDYDVCEAAKKAKMGSRMVDKILVLRRECHALAKELGLVSKNSQLAIMPRRMAKVLSLPV